MHPSIGWPAAPGAARAPAVAEKRSSRGRTSCRRYSLLRRQPSADHGSSRPAATSCISASGTSPRMTAAGIERTAAVVLERHAGPAAEPCGHGFAVSLPERGGRRPRRRRRTRAVLCPARGPFFADRAQRGPGCRSRPAFECERGASDRRSRRKGRRGRNPLRGSAQAWLRRIRNRGRGMSPFPAAAP